MEDDAADELDTIVDHVPGDFVASGHPVVAVDGVVAVYGDEVLALSGEFAVEVGGAHGDGLACGKAGGGLAHYGEDHGEVVVEFLLDDVENLLLVFVDLVP